jgi:hypothetical protein
MKVDITVIREIISSLFSKDGYAIKNLNIQFPAPLDLNTFIDGDNNINFTFPKELPKVSWKKFVTLSAWIQKIVLGQTEGVIKLKYLPEIRFSYDKEEDEAIFGDQINFDDISKDILREYPDEERKKIAHKCLQYAKEWVTITSSSGVNFAECSASSRKQLKKDCRNFVMDNLRNDPDMQAGSIILTFLLLYIVLPVILKFILERIFRKIFN